MNQLLKSLLFCLLTSCASLQAMSFLKSIFPPAPAPEQKLMIKKVYLDGEIYFQRIMNEVVNAARNNQVTGILLIIDNYGGRTSNYCMLHDLIKRVALIKPVVAFVSGAALSGGYAMASAADYIVAGSLAEIGSIGAFSEKWYYDNPDVTETQGDINVKARLEVERFQGGEFKGLYNPYKKTTPSERKYMQDHIDKVYKQFFTLIGQKRSLNLSDYAQWAEGKVFLANEALQLGLIDEIGTIMEAENKLIELIHTQNPEIPFTNLVYYMPE